MENCAENLTWGFEAIIDCKSGSDAIKDPVAIAGFCKELVKTIDMEAYGDPQIVHFGKDDKSGYTLMQLITTSNIVVHFCDQTGDAYVNVFSCKQFQIIDVRNCLQKWFEFKSNKERFLLRGV